MNTQPPNPDPNGLPLAPSRGCPVSAAMFDRLMDAARKGGWSAVFTVFAQGETITDRGGAGAVYERPARRSTLSQFLDNKRPDLKALLDNAAQERRDRLLSQLEDEVEKIALGAGDVTQDFDDKGNLRRTRVDRRNKLYALLKLLGSHNPDVYADRKKVDVAGQVNHAHAHAHLVGNVEEAGGYRVSFDALQTLPPDEQAQLLRLLEKVEAARVEQRQRSLPGQIGETQ
ncbi:MAG: hypothetical protein EDM82_05840 [Cyanobacteria bacterium CYA]|nr:MAG: hypothetical protein EDM82_05840 [Cyanobacteria bacterium CYA]